MGSRSWASITGLSLRGQFRHGTRMGHSELRHRQPQPILAAYADTPSISRVEFHALHFRGTHGKGGVRGR